MQQINSLVPSKKDSYYLPGFNRFAKYNKLEFSKARLLFAQILIVLAKELRLLLVATFLFVLNRLLSLSISKLIRLAFTEGSLAYSLLNITLLIAKVCTIVVIINESVSSNKLDGTNQDKIEKVLAVILVIWLGYFLSNIVPGTSNFSWQSILILSIIGAGRAFFTTNTQKKTEMVFNLSQHIWGFNFLLFTYISVLVLSRPNLYLLAMPLGFFGILGTVLIYYSLPFKTPKKVWKYLLTWVLSLALISGIVYTSYVKNLVRENALFYPQLLQVITPKDQDLAELRLPKPEFMGEGLKANLRDNQVEVYVIPYCFYQAIRLKKKAVTLDNRYQAIFVYPSHKTSNYKAIMTKDILELPNENVGLSFIFDTSGPLLNNDIKSRPVLVVSDIDFLSLSKKEAKALVKISLWQTKEKAKAAYLAYSKIGLKYRLSSSVACQEKLSRTSKMAVIFVTVLIGGALAIFYTSFNLKTEPPGCFFTTLGLSLMESSVLLKVLEKFQAKLLGATILGLIGLILLLMGLFWLRDSYRN